MRRSSSRSSPLDRSPKLLPLPSANKKKGRGLGKVLTEKVCDIYLSKAYDAVYKYTSIAVVVHIQDSLDRLSVGALRAVSREISD